MKKQIFVFGLDGANLSHLDRKGLANVKRLIDNGISGELLSRPAVTPIAWTSIVTGVNPGKHGIFGFRKGEKLIDSRDKKTKELWDYLKSIVVNVPMTYPVRPINGVMITGMMTPTIDSKGFVYPESERTYLKKIGYIIEPEIKLSSIEKSIKIRIELMRHYAFAYDWQLFFHVFREFDPLQHFFWGKELKYYQLVDELIGELGEKFPDAYLMIVSDHGFTKVNKTFNLSRWLKENFEGKAWAGDWGAVYLKLQYANTPKVKKELIKTLKNIKYQNKAVLDVYPREKIYWGRYASKGPEIIVSPKRELGFTFGPENSAVIDKSKKKNGCHLEGAAFVLAGPNIKKKKIKGKLYDVFPTILELYNMKLSENLDGRSLL